ncbi:MAG TPA: cereblon family protein [Vicinamibacteria bacterium]|nr:cereblon family protein [Vicinamibacteria bacterium]
MPRPPAFANVASLLLKGETPDVGGEARVAKDALLCAYCRALVTSRAAALEMSGSHAHTFVNPHGIQFRIGCFADAPGCGVRGAESSYWTWFPGFTWRISVCRHCGEHLGWLFRSPDARFYGLILDRLTAGD